MKERRHPIRNFILVLLTLTVIYWIGINVLVSAVLVPSFMERLHAFDRIVEQSYAEQVQETNLQNNAVSMNVIGNSWSRNRNPENVSILSTDGYELRGVVFAQDKKAHNWSILLHGYTGSKEMMYGYAYWYWQHGYNVLAPDFRCQGESEGDYIGLGATDSEDLLGWIDLILQRDPDARIVLHGLSMGASTALLCAGKEEIPPSVVAVISDCAYTDAYAMFQEKIGSWFHLPAFPIIDSAELMIRLRAGYDLKETSPLAAVGKSRIPTLFIHGTEDRMIPVKMCLLLYNAAACDKEIMIVDGAGHAQAAERDPVRYFDTVEAFLGRHVR
jgi:alpha-beta hydrolase superfamily lysophospholipase